MPYFKSWQCAWAGILVLALLWSVPSVSAVDTGPVDRKWGLGWDSGLTARLWLGGVWELALAAGPSDYLKDSEDQDYDTGYPPDWNEWEEHTYSEDRTESGFVRFQAGRLISRRGPLGVVCYSGLKYYWSDSRYSSTVTDVDDPDYSYISIRNYDRSTWTLSLGLRPSWQILDFLTMETAFGLYYSWFKYEEIYRREYTETGRFTLNTDLDDGNRFDDSGWSGMGSLQFIIWF